MRKGKKKKSRANKSTNLECYVFVWNILVPHCLAWLYRYEFEDDMYILQAKHDTNLDDARLLFFFFWFLILICLFGFHSHLIANWQERQHGESRFSSVDGWTFLTRFDFLTVTCASGATVWFVEYLVRCNCDM